DETDVVTGKGFMSASIRYVIPLGHPDTGSITIPVFLERYYLVLFSETLFAHHFRSSDTIAGFGARARIRLFYNMTLDIGLGVSFRPHRMGSETIVLDF